MTSTREAGAPGRGEQTRISKLIFLGLFLPVALLVVLIAFAIANSQFDKRVKGILEYDNNRLQVVSTFLGSEVMLGLKHLHTLTVEDVTLDALDAAVPAHLRALETSFRILAQRNPVYRQVRWIDENGLERVAVNYHGETPDIVAQADLRDVSGEDYFRESSAMLPGELYLSRIDLNTGDGSAGSLPRPLLHIATPVSGSDRQRHGIIIIDVDMTYLFDHVRTMDRFDQNVTYLLVSREGQLLSADYGTALEEDTEELGVDFATSYPDVMDKLLTNGTGSLESGDGMWTWHQLSPVSTFIRINRMLPESLITFDQHIADNFALILVAHRPAGTLEQIRSEHRELITVGSTFVLSIYALMLLLYLSGTARTRRAEVEAAQAQERVANLERMKELEVRFHNLVEATSIGLVVVNSEGVIEISNAAADFMLGFQRGQLEGTHVDTLLPVDMQSRHAELRKHFIEDPEARRMGAGRDLMAVRKDGSQIAVEVGLNPYTDNGRPMVLASIIDLSQSNETGLAG